jgi:hypothetical protein
MKVINLFGGPGSGKSTTAAGLFYQMKLEHRNVELITEYAKELVYSDRVSFLNSKQEYVFAKQNLRQFILRDKVDWAITDSPLLLSLIYPQIYNTSPGSHFDAYVIETFNQYDNVNFFLERPETFSGVGRVQNIEESIRVDNMIIDALDKAGIKYVRAEADPYDRMSTILRHLNLV